MVVAIVRRLSLIAGLLCLALLIALDVAIPTPLFYTPLNQVSSASWSVLTHNPLLLKRNLGLILALTVVIVNVVAVASKRYTVREKHCAFGAMGVLIGFLLQPNVIGIWFRSAV